METNHKLLGLHEMDTREIITLLPMVVLIFWIGVYPDTFLSFLHPSVEHLLQRLHAGGQETTAIARLMEIIK